MATNYKKCALEDINYYIKDETQKKKNIDLNITKMKKLKEFINKFFNKYDTLLLLTSDEYEFEDRPFKFIINDNNIIINELNKIFIQNKYKKHIFFYLDNEYSNNIIQTKQSYESPDGIELDYILDGGVCLEHYEHLIKCLTIFLNSKKE